MTAVVSVVKVVIGDVCILVMEGCSGSGVFYERKKIEAPNGLLGGVVVLLLNKRQARGDELLEVC